MPKPLNDRDRQFLAMVNDYLQRNDLNGIKADPVDGYQLVITYRRVKPALRKPA